jgi:hypothetical protein
MRLATARAPYVRHSLLRNHNLWRAAAAKSTKISARTPADSLRPCVFHLLGWQASPGQAADVHAVQLRWVAVIGLSQSLTVRDCSRTISLRPRLERITDCSAKRQGVARTCGP